MAALYLHQALFGTEPSTKSVLPANRATQHARRLSTVSSVTLHTSNTDHSQPTEPLLHPPESESSVYLDLLSRQPNHPGVPESSFNLGLSLEGDRLTASERKGCQERVVRKRLRRLRRTRRTMLLIMTSWALYNTVRYYVAFTVYRVRERQIILLALGTCTTLSVALVTSSLLISAFAPHIGWYHTPCAPHIIAQTVLYFSASLLLVGPAVANLVFVFLWRHTAEPLDTLHGRCHWDIDVLWSGIGLQCDASRSPAWGSWVAGAMIRLVLTLAVIITYHWSAYQYDITRQPSRKYRLFHPRASTTSTAPSQSFVRMTNASSPPVAIRPRSRRQSALSSTTDGTSESARTLISPEPRGLRKSPSRTLSKKKDGSKESFQLPPPNGVSTVRRPSPGRITPQRVSGTSSASGAEDESSSSSDEDSSGQSGANAYGRYGRPMRRLSGAYAPVATQSPAGNHIDETSNVPQAKETTPTTSYSDRELVSFADRFRSLVEQVVRESEEAAALAAPETPVADAGGQHVSMVGRMVHRMPTIESLGSREAMSLASSGRTQQTTSRPSTRMNDSYGTPSSRSRANSWDATLALATSVGTTTDASVSEMGELVPAVPAPATVPTTTHTTVNTGVSAATTKSYYAPKTSPQANA